MPSGLFFIAISLIIFIVFMLIIFIESLQNTKIYFILIKQLDTKELKRNSYTSFPFLSSHINNLLGAYFGDSPPPTKQNILLLFKF